MPASRRLVVVAAVLAVLSGCRGVDRFVGGPTSAVNPCSGRSARDASASFAIDFPNRSIGEVIDDSSLIVLGRSTGVVQFRWNSTDNTDWTDEFLADTAAFDTSPGPYVLAGLHVEEVLAGTGAEAGDVVTVHDYGPPAFAQGHSPGDEQHVVFLERGTWQLVGPCGDREAVTEHQAWVGGGGEDAWRILPGTSLARPVNFDHQASLEYGGEIGAVRLERAQGVLALSLSDLKDLIREERETPNRASVASYELWPWDPAEQEAGADA